MGRSMCFIRGVIGAIPGGRVREGRRCTDGIVGGSFGVERYPQSWFRDNLQVQVLDAKSVCAHGRRLKL